jgi:integrase
MRHVRAQSVDELLYLKGTDRTTVPILKSSKEIEAQVISFVIHLRDVDKISHSLRVAYLASVNMFYSMNDIVLNRQKIGRYLGEQVRINPERAFTREEIAKLLTFCDERITAVVLLLASSGVRAGALPTLRLKHLKEIPDYNLYRITVYEALLT